MKCISLTNYKFKKDIFREFKDTDVYYDKIKENINIFSVDSYDSINSYTNIMNELLNYVDYNVDEHREEIMDLLEKYEMFEQLCENIFAYKISIENAGDILKKKLGTIIANSELYECYNNFIENFNDFLFTGKEFNKIFSHFKFKKYIQNGTTESKDIRDRIDVNKNKNDKNKNDKCKSYFNEEKYFNKNIKCTKGRIYEIQIPDDAKVTIKNNFIISDKIIIVCSKGIFSKLFTFIFSFPLRIIKYVFPFI